MVAQILVNIMLFEIFIFLSHTSNVQFSVGLVMAVLWSLKVEQYCTQKSDLATLNHSLTAKESNCHFSHNVVAITHKQNTHS